MGPAQDASVSLDHLAAARAAIVAAFASSLVTVEAVTCKRDENQTVRFHSGCSLKTENKNGILQNAPLSGLHLCPRSGFPE